MASDLAGRWQPALRSLPLLSCVYLFLALGRLFRERWYVRLGKTIALWVLLITIELGLGMTAADWAARVTGQ